MDSARFGDDDENVAKTSILSDSIVITSNNDSISSAAHIMFQAAYLIRKSIELSIPLKGSLAFGKFTADFDKSIFFGQPLIDAYLLQEELNSYSIVLHHSFESFLIGKTYEGEFFPSNDRWLKHLTQFNNGRSNHYHLNWVFYLGKEEQKNLELKRDLLNKFYHTVSGKTRSYVDQTLVIFDEMKKP